MMKFFASLVFLIFSMFLSALSSDTLAALQDFYSERDKKEKDFVDLKSKLDQSEQCQQTPLSMSMFSEDWNASQFWV